MGWLEGINRRSARPKPLTSLPGADRACWRIFWWPSAGSGMWFRVSDQERFSEREKLKNHENYFCVGSLIIIMNSNNIMLLVVCSYR